VRRPVTVVFQQEFDRIEDAIAAERQVKGWRREKKEALIRGEYEALPSLARRGVRAAARSALSRCPSASRQRVRSSRPEEFRQGFARVPEYLRTPEDVYALCEYGPALGRRVRSLKLWAVLRCYGAEGLREIRRELGARQASIK